MFFHLQTSWNAFIEQHRTVNLEHSIAFPQIPPSSRTISTRNDSKLVGGWFPNPSEKYADRCSIGFHETPGIGVKIPQKNL